MPLLSFTAQKHALITWVRSTTLDGVVVDKFTNRLLSIKPLPMRQISSAALYLFCGHHLVPGYKDKATNVTCLCIIEAVRMKAVCKTMYLQFKDVSHAGNNNGDSNNTHDVVVLTGKEVDGNDEGNNIAVGEN